MDTTILESILKHVPTKKQVQLSVLNRASAGAVSGLVREVSFSLLGTKNLTESMVSWICRRCTRLAKVDILADDDAGSLGRALSVLAIVAGVHRDSLEDVTLRASHHVVDSLVFVGACRALKSVTVRCSSPHLHLPSVPDSLKVFSVIGSRPERGDVTFGPGCGSLQTLVLKSCGLRNLPDDFVFLERLEGLFLDGNRLSHTMNIGTVSQSLRKLSLRRCSLVRLPGDLSVLTNLAELDVSYNSIGRGSLDILDSMPSLKTLDLSHNAVKTLSGLRLPFLEHLDISCNIGLVDDWADAEVLPNLTFLMVSFIPHCDLRSLKILGLHGWCASYEPDPMDERLQPLPQPHTPNLTKIILYYGGKHHLSVPTVHALLDLVKRYPFVELRS